MLTGLTNVRRKTLTKTANKPALTIRDGGIKAAIWKNQSKNGVFYSVTFSRAFKDADGAYHDADSFSGTQLLQVAKLCERAYAYIT